MNQVVTELVIDGRGAQSGSATYIQAMAAAQAAVDRFIDRQKAMDLATASGSAVMTNSATSTARLASSLDRLKASIDPTFASARALERDIVTLDRAMTHLGTTEAEVAVLLDGVRLKHDTVAAAAKRQTDEYLRLAAAGRAALAADRSQSQINSTLGIAVPVSGAARDSASVFDAELTRMEAIGRLRAQQIGQNFGADLDRSLTSGTQKSAREAGSVFAAELDRLDNIAQLKAQQIGANFTADLNARFGIGRQVNSARESADVFASAPVGGRPRLNSMQVQGLGYQANDVVTMALLGASPSQIAFSQGGQILQNLQQGEGGIPGSLKAIKAGAGDAMRAVTAFLGPVGLIGTGFAAAGLAAGAFYALTRDRAKSVEDVLKQHKVIIDEIAAAYPHAAQAAKAYEDQAGKLPQSVAAANTIDQASDESKTLAETMNRIRSSMQLATQMSAQDPAASDFQRLGKAGLEAFRELSEQIKASQIDAVGVQKRIGDLRLDPALSKNAHDFAAGLQEAADNAAELELKLRGTNATIGAFNGVTVGRGDEAANMTKFLTGNVELARQLQQDRELSLGQLNAKSPEDRAAAARAAEAAKPFNPNESAENRRYREDTAAALAYAQAQKQITDAQEERNRSLVLTMASQQVDLMQIGKTAGEAARLRMEFDLIAQIRIEAARNGVEADAKEIAAIREKAREYGRYVDLLARANLQNDLAFERSQLFRSQTEQGIASRLRGTGIGMDSPEAQQMRDMQRFADAKDVTKGFFTDLKTEFAQNGGDIGEAFGDAAFNAASRSLDKVLDNIFDQLANSVASWVTGVKSGGGDASTKVGTAIVDAWAGKRAVTDNAASLAGSVGSWTAAAGALPQQYGPDLVSNINLLAKNIGANARDVAAAMSFESGFNPNIMGGAGGRYRGLIQMGPWEQQHYGLNSKTSLAGQFGGIEQFFKDRGFKPGMGMADLYSTINAGSPGRFNASDAANGGAPGTVMDKVTQQMEDHYQKADALLARSDGVMGKLGATTTQTTRNLSTLGNGMENLGSNLLKAPAGGSASGGSGGFFDWLGNLFSGGGGSIGTSFGPGIVSPRLAMGGAFDRGNVIPFARGDVMTSPAYFPMSGGRTGLMGEAGPEAIMPLRRGPDGRLGVATSGGGSVRGAGVTVKHETIINNYAGAKVEERNTDDGNGNTRKEINILDSTLAQASRRGEFNKELNARGAKRPAPRR